MDLIAKVAGLAGFRGFAGSGYMLRFAMVLAGATPLIFIPGKFGAFIRT